MKNLISFFILSLLFFSCSSDDDNKDEFSQRKVTASELESGTATYSQKKGTTTYYLVFENSSLHKWEYKGGEFTSHIYYDKYEIKGDSIYLTEKPSYYEELGGEIKHYTLYINMVHWGYDKTADYGSGGDQLLIRGDNFPYEFQSGYYDKNSISLK